jgi:hypothetical protein
MLEILMEGQNFCGHAQKTFTQPPKGAMTVRLFYLHSKANVQANLHIRSLENKIYWLEGQ